MPHATGTRRPLVGRATLPPSIASAAIRQRLPYGVGGVTTNNVASCRVFEKTNVAVQGAFVEYFNGWIDAGVAAGPQELPAGNVVTLKVDLLTAVSGTAYNQATATVNSLGWAEVSAGTPGFIRKLDNSGASPAFTARSFAQFQGDGGSVSGTAVTIPTGYYVRSDPGPDLPAGSRYALQTEETRPVPVTIGSLASSGTTATATVASTAALQTGARYTVSGATPAGYNFPSGVAITVVDGTTFTFPVAAGLASPATGTITLACVRPYYGQALIALGDIFRAASVGGLVGTADWSSVPTALTTNGQQIGGVVSVQGTSPGGRASIALYGDSITAQVNDANQNPPQLALSSLTSSGTVATATTSSPHGFVAGQTVVVSGASPAGYGGAFAIATVPSATTFTYPVAAGLASPATGTPNLVSFPVGDPDGAVGFMSRALNAAGLPYVKVAVPGTKADTARLYSDDNVRRWAARHCPVAWTGMGHNDATALGTYAAFKAAIQDHVARLRANGHGRILGMMYPPTSTSTDSWASRAGQTPVTGSFAPGGYIYANLLPDLQSGALAGPAWWDAFLDVNAMLAAVDGGVRSTWPTTSIGFGFTGDGTHPSRDGHAAIAAALTWSLLAAAASFEAR